MIGCIQYYNILFALHLTVVCYSSYTLFDCVCGVLLLMFANRKSIYRVQPSVTIGSTCNQDFANYTM